VTSKKKWRNKYSPVCFRSVDGGRTVLMFPKVHPKTRVTAAIVLLGGLSLLAETSTWIGTPMTLCRLGKIFNLTFSTSGSTGDFSESIKREVSVGEKSQSVVIDDRKIASLKDFECQKGLRMNPYRSGPRPAHWSARQTELRIRLRGRRSRVDAIFSLRRLICARGDD
jgi:hypothetical protein